jgi:pyruvate-formate lyase-activating enzyme
MEYEHGCPTLIPYIARLKLTKTEDIVKMVIAWAARMDPDAQAEQKAAHEAAEAKRKADNEAKKLERTKQKEAEAQKTRAELEKKIQERAAAAGAAEPAKA